MRAQGFEILGVSTDDIDGTMPKMFGEEKKEIADFVQQMHMPYPVLIQGDTHRASRTAGWTRCRLRSLSTALARWSRRMGITSKDDMEGNIKKALGS